MNKSPTRGETPEELIEARIAELNDWRGKTLAKLRAVITGTGKGIVEEWKWNTPVWTHHGIICTGESYKKAVKLTFAKGASLKDPKKLFNSSLEGATRRAIDFQEDSKINATALKALVREAMTLNASK
jgi:hypothetical protein